MAKSLEEKQKRCIFVVQIKTNYDEKETYIHQFRLGAEAPVA